MSRILSQAEIDALQGVDPIRISAQISDRVTHGSKVDDARHTRKILEDNARRHKRNLAVGGFFWVPGDDCLNISP